MNCRKHNKSQSSQAAKWFVAKISGSSTEENLPTHLPRELTQSCGKCGLLHAQLWGKYNLNAGKQIILLDCVRQIPNRYMKSRRAATKNV